MTEELNPDVVTLDLQMPVMDGLEFLREQMTRRPLPVVICSVASESGEMGMKALEIGAFDFVQKPSLLAAGTAYEMRDELIDKVKAASIAPISQLRKLSQPEKPPHAHLVGSLIHRVDIVVIGISTGGPQALRYVIPQLPADLPVPMAVVLHMPVGYTELYARSLNEVSGLEVREAQDGDELRPGTLLLAKAGFHLALRRDTDGRVLAHLDTRPLDTPHRPAADVLFKSAADVFGERVLGVVMTGMASDGKQGAAWIKSQGGLVFTEAEETCVVYGMPRSVVEAGLSDKTVPMQDMAQAILEVV